MHLLITMNDLINSRRGYSPRRLLSFGVARIQWWPPSSPCWRLRITWILQPALDGGRLTGAAGMNVVLLKGDDAEISIAVAGYLYGAADDPWDANWLDSLVSARVNSFSAKLNLSLTTHDFQAFGEELSTILAVLQGSARFRTLEDGLSLDIEMSGAGQAVVTGTMLAHGRATLNFSFGTDQTFLAQTREATLALSESYPPRGEW